MTQLEKFKTLGIRLIERFRSQAADDSVEGQAKLFRAWAILSAFALMISALSMGSNDRNEEASASQNPTRRATEISRLIPDGMVLIPISPINIDSLQSMVSETAWVDLYTLGLNGGRGVQVARSVRMIRAPRNPNRFAVVVRDLPKDRLPVSSDQVIVVIRKGPASVASTNTPRMNSKHGRRPIGHSIREPKLKSGFSLFQENLGDGVEDTSKINAEEENDENV